MKGAKHDSLIAGLDVECDFRTLYGERILAKDYLRTSRRFERMHHLGGSAHFDRDDYEISTFPVLYSLRDLSTAKLSSILNRLLDIIECDFYKASEILSQATGKDVFAVPNNIHISKSSASHDPNRNYQSIGVLERGFVAERISYDQIMKSRVPNVRTTRTKFRKEVLTVHRLDLELRVDRDILSDVEGDLLDLSEAFGEDRVIEQAWREYRALPKHALSLNYRQAWLNLAVSALEYVEHWNWELDWNTVVSLRKVNKITVGGWDVPIHGEKSYRDLLRWLLTLRAFQRGLLKNGPLGDYILIKAVAEGLIERSPYRTDEIIRLEGELPVVDDVMIHALGEDYVSPRRGVDVQPSIPTTLEALEITFKTEPSSVSAGMGTKYAVVLRERRNPKGPAKVIPIQHVEAIQRAVEIGRRCGGRRDMLRDLLFADRPFAALFGMHDFEFTQVGRGGLITYTQDNKRHLIYHSPSLKRAKVQKLVSQLERTLDMRFKKTAYEETIPCELLHVKKTSLIVEGNGFFLNHAKYHFKPNYDSLIGIVMLFSIGTILLILSLSMDYHRFAEVTFHSEIRRSILPFGIIPGVIFEIGACIYTWFTAKATYREMRLVSCYSNRLGSTEADAFEVILDNKYLKNRRFFRGLSFGLTIERHPSIIQRELVKLLNVDALPLEKLSTVDGTG
ncbi:MAG: hypothetical protein HYZ81_10950 [Nitrospinae bacterium]|nr:hypothetical protein [Nitrospinota bacterium]